MSPKKITDADKLEIVDLYRQTGDTTASLAIRYGVSNSTISRLLKMSIPEDEYDLLIQQKRGAKLSSDDDSSLGADDRIMVVPVESSTALETNRVTAAVEKADLDIHAQEEHSRVERQTSVPSFDDRDLEAKSPARSTFPVGESERSASMTEENPSASKRLVRRRSSARDDAAPAVTDVDARSPDLDPADVAASVKLSLPKMPPSDIPRATVAIAPPAMKTSGLRVPQLPVLREQAASVNRDDYFDRSANPIPTEDPLEDEVEVEDVNALAAMFGEEIAEAEDDDEEFTDEDDWDEEPVTVDLSLDRDVLLTGDRAHIQVTPLSQATLPRTCYIVIDKFAELIVRPLKDFAELGQIPGEEIQQRTLPIFDNHRVAKRFSNQRTQRVIKVPDSRVFQKTLEHLRSKGIARLLVDGNVYSLN